MGRGPARASGLGLEFVSERELHLPRSTARPGGRDDAAEGRLRINIKINAALQLTPKNSSEIDVVEQVEGFPPENQAVVLPPREIKSLVQSQVHAEVSR